MNDITLFDYSGQQVRTVLIDGEPWFVLSDLTKVLGLSQFRADRLDSGLIRNHPISDRLGRTQQATIVNEAGMYEVVIRSDKPEAITFRRWITTDVLPQIRRTGSYGMQRAIPTHAEALRGWADAIEQAEISEARIAELEPAAKAWGHIVDASGTISFADAAKALSNCPDVTVGRNRLFKLLAAWGWIYRSGSRDREAWSVYQDQIETGRLVTKVNKPFLNSKTGEYEVTAPTIRLTTKGMDEIHRRLTTTELRAVGA